MTDPDSQPAPPERRQYAPELHLCEWAMRVLIPRPLPCEGNGHGWKPVFDRALKGPGGRISAGQRAGRPCPSVALSAGGGRSFRAISAPCFTAEVRVPLGAGVCRSMGAWTLAGVDECARSCCNAVPINQRRRRSRRWHRRGVLRRGDRRVAERALGCSGSTCPSPSAPSQPSPPSCRRLPAGVAGSTWPGRRR